MKQSFVVSMIALAIPINAAYSRSTVPGAPVKASPSPVTPAPPPAVQAGQQPGKR